jgi:hypothetical protein
VNEIYRKRYEEDYNKYFVKLIQNIISFEKDDIICVKIKETYKLLSETKEDEYKNVECIYIDNIPLIDKKYYTKQITSTDIEIYEFI